MDTVSAIDMVEDELIRINDLRVAQPALTDPIWALQVRLHAMSMDAQAKRDAEFLSLNAQNIAISQRIATTLEDIAESLRDLAIEAVR